MTAMLSSAQDLRSALPRARRRASFDIMFLDPPYGAPALDRRSTRRTPLTPDGTLLVIEHARRDEAPAERGGAAAHPGADVGRQRAGVSTTEPEP